MNEQELRDGLREVMAVSSQPPTMNPTETLDAAKRAHKRRRATWAGAGASAAVVALAAGTVFVLNPGGEPLQIQAASGPATTGTETSWPNGQVDRTARQGPRAETANSLLTNLKAALPGTLTVDGNLAHPTSGNKVTTSQANFSEFYGPDNKQESWQYTGTAAVTTKAALQGGTGRVIVEVHTPGPRSGQTDVCALASGFWGGGSGSCETRTVQGKAVGVATTTGAARIDSVAAYRYEDGTTVYVAQSKKPFIMEAGAAMPPPPLTLDQLSTLAINPAFKVK